MVQPRNKFWLADVDFRNVMTNWSPELCRSSAVAEFTCFASCPLVYEPAGERLKWLPPHANRRLSGRWYLPAHQKPGTPATKRNKLDISASWSAECGKPTGSKVSCWGSSPFANDGQRAPVLAVLDGNNKAGQPQVRKNFHCLEYVEWLNRNIEVKYIKMNSSTYRLIHQFKLQLAEKHLPKCLPIQSIDAKRFLQFNRCDFKLH